MWQSNRGPASRGTSLHCALVWPPIHPLSALSFLGLTGSLRRTYVAAASHVFGVSSIRGTKDSAVTLAPATASSDSNELKIARNGNLHIYPRDSDAHRAITKKLSEVNLQYTDFCLSLYRAYRVVMCNLAASTLVE